MPEDDVILVFSTCNSVELANQISEALVKRKLAACVNILPGIKSVYQWQDKLVKDNELLLIIKTRKTLFTQLQKAIQELHDYELPEVIAVPVELGEQTYLNWIKSATSVTEQNNENK